MSTWCNSTSTRTQARTGDDAAASGGVARPGRASADGGSAARWTGPDTLAVELPLHGGETSLATVAIPGQHPVSLPPVCLPYSPEFQPPVGSEGTAALERLGRATGGKERALSWRACGRSCRGDRD